MLGNQPSLSLYLQPILQLIWPGFVAGQYRARLLSKHWQTPNMLLLNFKVSRRWPGFVPGQHLLLTLEHNGKRLSRPFSLCSPLSLWQARGEIELCCKVSPHGSFTPLLANLTGDSIVSISAAQGDFSWQQPATPTLFIAAGSGITPLAAMLLSQRHWLAPVQLVYRVRGTENAALLERLQQLAAQQPLFTLTLSDSRFELRDSFVKALGSIADNKQLYICGPAAFMQHLKPALLQAGVPEHAIHQEQFGSAPLLQAPDTQSGHYRVALQTLNGAQVFTASAGHSLLQSAEQQGLSPRFGCRIGVCFQCVCDKLSGQVRDIRSGALSSNGSEQIQLCISQPVTDLVLKQ